MHKATDGQRQETRQETQCTEHKIKDETRDTIYKTQGKDKEQGEIYHIMKQITIFRSAAIASRDLLNLAAF